MVGKKIVVIGGSAAGPKAAAKARRMDESAEITLIQKSPYLSMASCGYPYYVGGFFDNRNMLLCTPTGVVRDPKFYLNTKKIDARIQTEALSIDRIGKKVRVKNLKTGEEENISYDSLVIATGALPIIPAVPGRELKGISTLQNMEDADFLRTIRDEKKISKAVVIGGGLIGIEASEALRLAGIETAIVERMPQLLGFLDLEMAKLVENYVRNKGVTVHTSNGLEAFEGENGHVTGVRLANGEILPCSLVVVAVGVRPNSALAKEAGLEIGSTGGIVVDHYMGTSDPNIFAAGDCVEIEQIITRKKIHAPYGDLANLEGRVAGENAVIGKTATFSGSIQTGICKIFDYAAGTTGLNERSARQNGFNDIETVINASPDKPGFMSGKPLISKLVIERKTGKILGAQCIGLGDVSKQIVLWATAIKGNLTVEDMVNADLPYAPPFSLALDHGIATAHLMQNKMKGRLKGISATMVKEKLDSTNPPFLLDVRDADEFEAMRLGVGEKLIPLNLLRARLNEIPVDKEIICYCKISLRGYEAALILEGNGWKNVQVMEGGVLAWPFPREK
ncbi:MAG: pyridine nucleotide-disulfide oxidoreductase [Proteobacteria bacterium]|nr:FAD-dependent oxidoreductase [Alphaproteobacteria bacterium]NCC03367.1 pyridine nucleotide-disulfide oxidoreductase [Pseudomonadota bacterium]